MQICVPLPEWLSHLGLNGDNIWTVMVLFGVAFWLGSQGTSTGVSRAMIGLSKLTAKGGPGLKGVSTIFWVLGSVFGKIGFDEPHEVKKESVEKRNNSNQ